MLVDEDPHELRDADDGVRVVELERDAVGDRVPVLVVDDPVEQVTERRSHEEVLLLQAQLLALRRRVLRVEDLRDVLGVRLAAHGGLVVAGVEGLEVERLGRARAPQPERVDVPGAVPGYEVVVGDGLDRPAGRPAAGLGGSVLALDRAAEADRDRHLGVGQLPRRAERQPVVRLLDLAAVDERLPEDPVLVPDAVAHGGDVEGRERVDEARREPAEAAVAEPGLDLLGDDLVERDVERGEGLACHVGQAGGEERVLELAPEQVLGGQVGDDLGPPGELGREGVEPPVDEVAPHRAAERLIEVGGGGRAQAHALLVEQLVAELGGEGLG